MTSSHHTRQTAKPSSASIPSRQSPASDMQDTLDIESVIQFPSIAGQQLNRQMLRLQRTIGNQATLRYIERQIPAVHPMPIQQKTSQRYARRSPIQRAVMPYEAWKDYSDGSFFSMRPDELKKVDKLLQTFHKSHKKDTLTTIVYLLLQYQGNHTDKEWKKNKRAPAVEKLIQQARETLKMMTRNMVGINLLSVSEFKELTREDGRLWGDAGLSSFQEEIIVKLTEFHKLGDPTGSDLDGGISLLIEIQDLTASWIDQYEDRKDQNRPNRHKGFKAFQGQLTDALGTLHGYMAGQLEQDNSGGAPQNPAPQNPVPAPQPKYKRNLKQKNFIDLNDPNIAKALKDATGSEIDSLKKAVDIKHEGDAKSMFRHLSILTNQLAGNSGERGEIDIEFKFPIPAATIGPAGAFVGGHFKVVVEHDLDPFKKPEEMSGVKLRGDMTFTAGLDFVIGEVKGELGGYLETRGNTSEQACTLMSYAFYRRIMDSSSETIQKIGHGIWGGSTRGMGKKRSEKWARNVEKEILTVGDNYAELGVVGVVGAKASVTNDIEIGLKGQKSWGRKYNKKLIDQRLEFLADAKERRAYIRDLKEQMNSSGLTSIQRDKLIEDFDKNQYDKRVKKIEESRAKKLKELKEKLDKKALSQDNYDLDVEAVHTEHDRLLARQEAVLRARTRHRDKDISEKQFEKAIGKETPIGYEDSDQWEVKFDIATPIGKFEAKFKKKSSERSNWELSAIGFIYMAGMGALGKAIEGAVVLVADAAVTLLRKQLMGGNPYKQDVLTVPASLGTGIASGIINGGDDMGFGIATKDTVSKIKLGDESKKTLAGITKKSGDKLESAGGFGLTLKLGVKDDKWYGSMSLERVTEHSLSVGVFKGKYKKQKRYIGLMFKDGNWSKPKFN